MTYQEWLGFMQQYLQSVEKYSSIYSGQQIDTAVGKALNPDTTPTASSSALVTSGGVKSAIDQLGVVDAPSGTTSLLALYSTNVPLGEIRTYFLDNNAITNLTDYPSSFSNTKFCAFVTIMRSLSNRLFYRLDAVSSLGVPKSAVGYPLSGAITWVDL